ncbi:guanine nucleotide-binding protein subunit alpha-14-like [Nerophis lumbriciformis]|uniref:guanine nucleotide-binding protein subunit alpha-14-like n=1 Tax=Nerophis lumbriciformis TaxID=546530 RepID=UPI002AE004B3|nr:guanine nucleotide-binding protein subunit alpha-11-like [Nerophis lumbriciformis]
MLPCCSTDDDDQIRVNIAIERQLQIDKQKSKNIMKILFLGTAESGKSTFIKQIRILHGSGYTEAQRRAFARLVSQNVVTAIQKLVEAMGILHINYAHNSNIELAKRMSEVQFERVEKLEAWQVDAIRKIWNDHGIQKCYHRRRQFQLSDSAKYYLTDLDRISAPNYIPNEQDVLRVRIPTTGIIEYPFKIKGATFKMVDVGGQRSERKKWIHCFDNVKCIIFLAALNDYDQVFLDDPQHNRMEESLALFETLVTANWFTQTSFILFLNKTDLLEEKVLESNVVDHFPNYRGPPHNATKAREFILELYKMLHRGHQKHLYMHYTCATDTQHAKAVFKDVQDMLLNEIFN